ncbi:unnamed protein product [Acanthoscelides obtectus]|uniref:Uncharacterized protein n=1 Tax=Acanthoscelides obtectus TaxID=200917 RepID=A0A9P0PUB5_ACAOB|nr:unnamed protein product [Acanthoscelides obtectus]CAK1624265.1 hypothetical protein AOBTE_LOCUS2454 [Acanthoscelides obtectus]
MSEQGPLKNESVIINLDNKSGDGSHWVSDIKRGMVVWYYDSFGNLRLPKELIKYLTNKSKKIKLLYNYNRQQQFNTFWCGDLCLRFLSEETSER